HGTLINTTIFHPDLIIRSDAHEDVLWCIWRRRVVVVFRDIDINTDFFNKRSGYDKEDQHDKDHVQHGGQVDIVGLVSTTAFFSSAHRDYSSSVIACVICMPRWHGKKAMLPAFRRECLILYCHETASDIRLRRLFALVFRTRGAPQPGIE